MKKGAAEKEWLVERKIGGEQGDEDEEEEQQDSPEGPAVVLGELWLDVGEEEVRLTREGEELVVVILRGLGGNESFSVASSSNGSVEREREKEEGEII